MIKNLLELAIKKRVPKALEHPIRLEIIEMSPAYDLAGTNMYENATVSFPLILLKCLNQENLTQLEETLYQTTVAALLAKREQIPPSLELLKPDRKKNTINVVDHELEHGLAARLTAQLQSRVDVTFTKGDKGRNINGCCQFGSATFRPREAALICSNPRSLSAGDIAEARKFAGLTNDRSFIDFIESRIVSRARHNYPRFN